MVAGRHPDTAQNAPRSRRSDVPESSGTGQPDGRVAGAQQILAEPVFKSAGGKRRMLRHLLPRVPARYCRYYEPFAGGAALFFALAPEAAVLGDANHDLIALYDALAQDVEDVIGLLGHLEADHGEQRFYELRNDWNARLFDGAGDQAAHAAAMLYLNRSCFNGLWRVNQAGEFNAPFGDGRPVSIDRDNLRAASQLLQRAELRAGDFEDTLADIQAGDFAYLDSPYDGGFTSYTAGSFGEDDQRRLAACARRLDDRGVHILLSNSDTPLIRELYDWALIETVMAPRAIAANPASRGAAAELLIRNPGAMPVAAQPEQETHMARAKKTKKQTEIPGTERKDALPDVEEKSDEYIALRDKRAKLQAEEKDLKEQMAELLRTHKRTAYKYVDGDGITRIVQATSKTNVTVSKEKNADEDGDE